MIRLHSPSKASSNGLPNQPICLPSLDKSSTIHFMVYQLHCFASLVLDDRGRHSQTRNSLMLQVTD